MHFVFLNNQIFWPRHSISLSNSTSWSCLLNNFRNPESTTHTEMITVPRIVRLLGMSPKTVTWMKNADRMSWIFRLRDTIPASSNWKQKHIFFEKSCWPTRSHIGRSTGISNPASHPPQVWRQGLFRPQIMCTSSLHCPIVNSASTPSQQPSIGRLINSNSSTQILTLGTVSHSSTDRPIAWVQWL